MSLSVLSHQALKELARHCNVLLEDLVAQRIAHFEHRTLMLIGLESEESAADLLANVLVKRVRAVFTDQLIEYIFVLINLELG